eukprot:6196043-Pleurochrysis_carterae.AAC.3
MFVELVRALGCPVGEGFLSDDDDDENADAEDADAEVDVAQAEGSPKASVPKLWGPELFPKGRKGE